MNTRNAKKLRLINYINYSTSKILKMMVFSSCCFCIPLRIGCFIIGYVHLIYHSIQTILTILILKSGIELEKLDPEYEDIAEMLITRSAITMFFLFVFLAFTVFLLVGLHKERRGFLKAFLVYALIFLIIYMVLFFVSLGYGYIGIWNIVFGLLEIFIGAYFLLVIRSQYVAMGPTHISGA